MKSSKSSLFLMELIIAILFFALASAVCIQLFVKSHLLGKTTTEENHALLMCQNFSEIYLGILPEYYDAAPENMKNQIISLVQTDSSFASIRDYSDKCEETFSINGEFSLMLSYDTDWNSCAFEDSCYQVVFVYEGYHPEADIYTASTYAYKTVLGSPIESYEEIYHLNISKHIPERME